MQAATRISSTVLPLDRSDVDTDQIIPASWLKRVERTGFGEGLFSEWRKDPEFILNNPAYANAQVLVAGANFGTGSSREHAVWALQDYGIKAVVSSRFGDIFKNNCTKVGIVPVVVESDVAASLIQAAIANPNTQITVDVAQLQVSAEALGIVATFEMDAFTQHRLLEGLDDIGLTLRFADAISAYEQRRLANTWLPNTVGALE
jgi:3-isopropylmalate/(R)-2-methylmalate dehydratase small subunit